MSAIYASSAKFGWSASRRAVFRLLPRQTQPLSSLCHGHYPISFPGATQTSQVSTASRVSPRIICELHHRLEGRKFSSLNELQMQQTGVGKKAKNKKNDRENKKNWERRFRLVDKVRIRVRGGKGGSGCLSHTKLSGYKLHPNGGHGGPGGAVIIMAHEDQQTLKMSRKHIDAKDGGKGGSNDMRGRSGKNTIVRVPCGVVVKRVLDFDEEWDEKKQTVVRKGGEEIIPKLDDAKLILPGDGSHYANDNLWFAEDGNYGPDDEDESAYETSSDDSAYEISSDDSAYETSSDDSAYETSSDDSDTFSDDELSENSDKAMENVTKIEFVNEEENDLFDDGEKNDLDSDEESDEDDYEEDEDEDAMMERNFADRPIVQIADLDKHGAYVVVARGGRGGIGTTAYAKMHGPNRPSNDVMVRKSAPEFGEDVRLELELKLIADIGLVGFPNAGKSSLLRAMSHATPKVAPYPFTTLHPLLGVIRYGDGFAIRAADIPGLIAGASQGRGCGHGFLRHIERTKALLYILDAAGTDGRNPHDDLCTLVSELEHYGDGDLLERRAIVIANKTDLLIEEEIPELLFSLSKLADELGIRREYDIQGISAGVTGDGLGPLSRSMRELVIKVDEENEAALEAETQEIL